MSVAEGREARDNVQMASPGRPTPRWRQRSGGASTRGRVGVLGRSGAVVGLLLIVVASALAFALTDSTAARTTLPSQIQIGRAATTAPSAVSTTISATTTTAVSPSTTSPQVTSTTISLPLTTSVPSTTIASSSSNSGKTTIVVKAVPTVRVEDDKGNQLGDEGSEAGTGAVDDKRGTDS